MRRVLVVLVAAAAAAGGGWRANARYVHKAGDEGIVAVGSNSDAWPEYNRTNALKLIEQHVGPGYQIVEEKEVVTGSVTNNTQQTKDEATFNSEIPFLPASKQTTTTTSNTTPVTEWQIHYRRASAVGAPALPVAAGPAPGLVQATHTTAPTPAAVPPSVSPAALTAGSPALPPPNFSFGQPR